MIDPAVLENYSGWLHATAWKYSSDSSTHEDLVQEGRIAMWRGLTTFDASKGSLPSWLTSKARRGMLTAVQRRIWTGTPVSPPHVREIPAPAIDPDKILTSTVGVPESADLAYHRAEILAAVACLPPGARAALYRRFWLDESVPCNSWSRYRPMLAQRLSHLRDAR